MTTTNLVIAALGWGAGALALCGGVHAIAAAALAGRFMAKAAPAPRDFPAVSLIKPLHRHPEGLAEALESFCVQDYPGRIQLLFGAQAGDDPAVEVVRALQARHPASDIGLVIDPRVHGANRKVSNLINIAAAAKHDILILSDADISVEPDYLRTVVGALGEPGVGAVSCLYVGRGGGGVWSRLNAMAIDYQFLPNAIVGLALGLARPCFGSTIAITRRVLDQIGGFEAAADCLADDYEIGRAVRRHGYAVAIPSMVLSHVCSEVSLKSLIDHEIRWSRTVRLIDPAGYAGSAITYALPLALIAAALLGPSPLALGLIFTILVVRIALKFRIDAATGARAGPWWLLPPRDVLSFGVFLASLAGNSVVWQGRRFRVSRGGVLTHP